MKSAMKKFWRCLEERDEPDGRERAEIQPPAGGQAAGKEVPAGAEMEPEAPEDYRETPWKIKNRLRGWRPSQAIKKTFKESIS